MTDAECIKRAREMYASDDIEIDDDAKVSEGDAGAFVQAWVWVPRPEQDSTTTEES
jgi:hypothetical protein